MSVNRETLKSLHLDHEAVPRPAKNLRLLGYLAAVTAALAAIAVVLWLVIGQRAVAVQTAAATPVGNGAGSSPALVLNASGYVVAEQQATVSSQVTGLIKEVLVDEGMQVQAGQVLARLDDQAAKAQLAAAQGQLLTDTALVRQAQARLAADQLSLRRQYTLYKRSLTSDAALNDAQAAVKIDTASLAHADGQVQVDRDNLSLARVELGYTVIRAPFAGMVTEKYAHAGEMISPAAVGGFTRTGICMLVDMHSLEVDVDVSEAYIQRVHAGQRVDAVLDAYPDWHIPAHVLRVVPTADRDKATVKVRIAFDQLDNRILPQMGVQVWFMDDNPKAAGAPADPQVQIPLKALLNRNGGSYVFVADNGRAERVAVKPGAQTGDRVVILAGLQPGQQVIVSSAVPLSDGTAVDTGH